MAWFWYGSPANRYGLTASRLIVGVDDRDVTDLDGFLAAVADLPDRSSVRLRTVSLDGKMDVMTLKLDLEFWPTTELRRNGAAGVVCWLVNAHPYTPALRRHGFFNSRRDPLFTLRPSGMPAEELAFVREPRARVHLTHGDTDVI